uniref:AMP-activated protein kinase glycogen-binding domain-containing protein n=1 Tax=Solanum lycopersicum TaxID=4081 RepID=A0A3Q7ETH0_SOLLC
MIISPSDSDAWEFQENEFMNARERLRLIRAKLAVLEGKMTLKMLDEKQKMIDRSSKALQLLRTARIVWTNSASEVLLAGSFDGWTTQRKMEKSSTGVFSVSLKLYPGRYEIKFVVDGIWKIDPLRPIVHSDGHENNLFIVT